jgi:preprotein translocase subunit YajC
VPASPRSRLEVGNPVIVMGVMGQITEDLEDKVRIDLGTEKKSVVIEKRWLTRYTGDNQNGV